MKFKTKRLILLLLGIVVLLFPVFGDLRRYGMPNTWDYRLKYYVAYLSMIAVFWIYHKIVWKCPHCGKNPGYKVVDRCTHCNELLDE